VNIATRWSPIPTTRNWQLTEDGDPWILRQIAIREPYFGEANGTKHVVTGPGYVMSTHDSFEVAREHAESDLLSAFSFFAESSSAPLPATNEPTGLRLHRGVVGQAVTLCERNVAELIRYPWEDALFNSLCEMCRPVIVSNPN
jgi:hypothetical protein